MLAQAFWSKFRTMLSPFCAHVPQFPGSRRQSLGPGERMRRVAFGLSPLPGVPGTVCSTIAADYCPSRPSQIIPLFLPSPPPLLMAVHAQFLPIAFSLPTTTNTTDSTKHTVLTFLCLVMAWLSDSPGGIGNSVWGRPPMPDTRTEGMPPSPAC